VKTLVEGWACSKTNEIRYMVREGSTRSCNARLKGSWWLVFVPKRIVVINSSLPCSDRTTGLFFNMRPEEDSGRTTTRGCYLPDIFWD